MLETMFRRAGDRGVKIFTADGQSSITLRVREIALDGVVCTANATDDLESAALYVFNYDTITRVEISCARE